MQTRDQLRSAIFASENKKLKKEVINFFGSKVEIRQPTLGLINKISRAEGSEDISPLVNILIEYAYVPETDERVFDKADRESLNQLPAGPWITELNKAIESFTNVDVKGAEKNSDTTT